MARQITAVLLGLATAASVLTAAEAAPKSKPKPQRPSAEHIYYDISDDPAVMRLLALSDSGEVAGKQMLDETNVHRSPDGFVGHTWRIDCPAERMAIVHTTVKEAGSPLREEDVQTPAINPRGEAKSWLIFQLACTGKGDLVERRVHRGDLVDIMARFWGVQR